MTETYEGELKLTAQEGNIHFPKELHKFPFFPLHPCLFHFIPL